MWSSAIAHGSGDALLHTSVVRSDHVSYCCLPISSKLSPLVSTRYFYPENCMFSLLDRSLYTLQMAVWENPHNQQFLKRY